MTDILPEEKSMPVLASDEYRVWIVAVSCSMIAFFLFGVFRSYGILYLEIIITFHTTRAQASWPLSLCASIMNVVGIFAGLLIHYVSARCIVFTGMVVLALSFSLCFLAQNMVHLIVFLGVLQGTAIGFVFPMLPVIISRNFHKYRALAIGLTFSGATISSFIFPPLFEHLLYTYSLRGTLLIIGGVVLHAVFFAIGLQPGSLIPSKTLSHQTTSLTLTSINEGKSSIKEEKIENMAPNELSIQSPVRKDDILIIDIIDVLPKEGLCEASNENVLKREDSLKDNGVKKQLKVKEKKCANNFLAALKILFSLCSSSMFLLIAITHSVFFNTIHTFLMIIVDFAVDRGDSEESASHLIIEFSATDIFGSVLLSWISDRFSIKKKNSIVPSILLQGILFALFSVANNKLAMHLLCLSFGMLTGLARVLVIVVVPEYLGLENQAIAQGLLMFVVGVTSMGKPLLIGYFRDETGSYDNVFLILGVLSIIVALLWLLEPLLKRQRVITSQQKVT
ncbi:monocarboxylate transporter 13-like isoform X1 [Tachypleus tridentatus]|uniref:monocarboxylate transporter 13-like isoform X1 n=1 Tax=Tachypleus tridentatus TaxID=6853 RepID=UPI003FD11189